MRGRCKDFPYTPLPPPPVRRVPCHHHHSPEWCIVYRGWTYFGTSQSPRDHSLPESLLLVLSIQWIWTGSLWHTFITTIACRGPWVYHHVISSLWGGGPAVVLGHVPSCSAPSSHHSPSLAQTPAAPCFPFLHGLPSAQLTCVPHRHLLMLWPWTSHPPSPFLVAVMLEEKVSNAQSHAVSPSPGPESPWNPSLHPYQGHFNLHSGWVRLRLSLWRQPLRGSSVLCGAGAVIPAGGFPSCSPGRTEGCGPELSHLTASLVYTLSPSLSSLMGPFGVSTSSFD